LRLEGNTIIKTKFKDERKFLSVLPTKTISITLIYGVKLFPRWLE